MNLELLYAPHVFILVGHVQHPLLIVLVVLSTPSGLSPSINVHVIRVIMIPVHKFVACVDINVALVMKVPHSVYLVRLILLDLLI